MAAPTVVSSLRLLRLFSRNCAHVKGPFATHLQSLDVQPQSRLVASNVNAKGPLEGSLDDSGCHRGVLSPATTAANTEQEVKTIPISPERAHQEMLLLKTPDQPADARVIKVAIIGSPNAGKSTLINSLIGQRICSVSSKVHTTRSNALGVLTSNNTQIVLLDTPGMVNHKQGRKHNLARSLLIDPKNSLGEVDLALVLVDTSNKWTRAKLSKEILMSLHLQPKVSSILVLNKVDLISNKQELFSITAQLTEGIIQGQKFTLDDRTARHLGKVEIRALLSHKYKPRLPKDTESDTQWDDVERTENEDRDTMKAAERLDSVIATSSQEKQDNLHCGDASVKEDFVEPTSQTNSSDVESYSPLVPQGSSSAGNSVDLSPTLREYVSNLEQYSSRIDDTAGDTLPPVHPAEVADDGRAEREERKRLLRELGKKRGWDGFEAVFMVSALEGEGVNEVREHLVSRAVPGNWDYHRDVVTNLSPEEILVEAIREKLLEYLPQEVPYSITQKNDTWLTEESGRLRIVQTIVCHKKSHVKLLKKNIGLVAREAEQSLMNAFHRDVYLTLRIKLR